MITLGEWLAQDDFGLVMSSGFFSFFAHTGMLSALVARGLRPRRLAGSSAGALVGGAYAAGVEPEALGGVLSRLERADFWDPAPGLGLLAGRRFDELLRRVLPVARFEACATPVAMSVFDLGTRTTRVIDRGDLPTAIRASCAVPGMFHPVRVDGRPSWDGGILDRPGLLGMPTGRTLYHHIASKSPWRRRDSAALALPRRADLVSLVIAELPRSGPFRLDAGRRALVAARAATLRALDRAISDDVVAA